MKIMHISDLHLGKIIYDVNMLEDQRYSLNLVLKEIDCQKVDVLIIAGDIYDKSNPSQEALNLFNYFINEISKKNIYTFIISGNHDSSLRLEYLSSFLRDSKIYISKSFSLDIEKITLEDEYGKVNFYLLPFFKLSLIKVLAKIDFKNYDEAIAYLFKDKINSSERNVLIAHQYVNGAITSESEELMLGGLDGISYEAFNDFDYVALGHLHNPQRIKRDTIRYCGTLIKYSFSEVNYEKSITVVDMNKDIEVNTISLTYFHDLKEIKGKYADLINHPYTEDYFKVTLTDEDYILDARINLLSVFPNMMVFRIENSKTNSEYEIKQIETIENFSPLELFIEFYKMQNNDVEPEDAQKKVIEQLIKGEEL